jgi:hypothetical protein
MRAALEDGCDCGSLVLAGRLERSHGLFNLERI